MKWTNRPGYVLSAFGVCTSTTLALGIAAAACLSRPMGQQPPTTKVNFTSTVSQQAVDKVDILFAIDNSASMGDKQAILADAVPDLINGLLRPKCVNLETGQPNGQLAEPTGSKENKYGCTGGTDPEFKPVTDMHIGIVSSSLGNFGGDVCPANNPRNNDRGKLINFNDPTGNKGQKVPLAVPGDFLAWFPQSADNEDTGRHLPPPNPVRQLTDLSSSFRNLVLGVEQDGCGLEAQLESMYRFLIQPDPWQDIKVDGNGRADLGEGVDSEVLRQRADFLRPDSLVAVIMLTDEDDSSADPLAVAGQGYAFMSRAFPGSNIERAVKAPGEISRTAPRGTSICDTEPGSPDCTTCGCAPPALPACQKRQQDPNCRESGLAGQSGPGFDGYYGPTDDQLNVRFHRMKQRYGADPQYPIRRYVDGFTKYKVPDRAAEHVVQPGATPDARRLIADYTSTPKCTNPLFASKLPTDPAREDLCDLPRSTRTPDLIFFAVVGGVPNELLYPGGYKPNDPEANRVTNDKWVTILGRDPLNYDYSGIDPHMIQSVTPRPGLSGAELPRGQNGSDPVHGREWNSGKEDLQYACTFNLYAKGAPVKRTCTGALADASCDCIPGAKTNPPLCEGDNVQVKAKAYPTIREFEVVRALGDQGVAASLCPIQLDEPAKPDYGYRPAVASIIDRLKNALTQQCLPQKLRDAPADPNAPAANVDCLVLAQLSPDSTGSCEAQGLEEPGAEVLEVFVKQQREETGNVAAGGAGGLDLANLKVCKVTQEAVRRGESCKDNADKRWCYVENDKANSKSPAGRCPQALIFSSGTQALARARFSLQCIRQFGAGSAAGDTNSSK